MAVVPSPGVIPRPQDRRSHEQLGKKNGTLNPGPVRQAWSRFASDYAGATSTAEFRQGNTA